MGVRIMVSALAATAVLAVTGCTGLPMPSFSEYGGGTLEDYLRVVDASEAVLDDAIARLPDGIIERRESVVDDLDDDAHRLSCSATTSQYVNSVNLWLIEGADLVTIIDDVRAELEREGWSRSPSGDEQDGEVQAPTGNDRQSFKTPDGFGLSISKADDEDDAPTLMQFSVFSPCIANPADVPSTWGR